MYLCVRDTLTHSIMRVSVGDNTQSSNPMLCSRILLCLFSCYDDWRTHLLLLPLVLLLPVPVLVLGKFYSLCKMWAKRFYGKMVKCRMLAPTFPNGCSRSLVAFSLFLFSVFFLFFWFFLLLNGTIIPLYSPSELNSIKTVFTCVS